MKITTRLSDISIHNLKYARKLLSKIKGTRYHLGIKNPTWYHFTYCIFNLVNSKVYFGKHSTWKELSEDKYRGSGIGLTHAINKYGEDKFIMLVLKFYRTEKQAYIAETDLITEEMVKSPYCYNRQGGGLGFASGKLNYIHTRIRNGDNPLLKRADGSSIGGDSSKRLVLEGKHHLLKRKDGTSIASDKVKNGTSFCLTKKWSIQCKRVARERVENGTHHLLNVLPWNNSKATIASKLTWALADEVFKIHIKNPEYGAWRIAKALRALYSINIKISPDAINLKMMEKLKVGWIPKQDKDWRKFKVFFMSKIGEQYG